MGFGEKARVWSREQESRAKANPDPGHYNLLTDIEEGMNKKKGIVFGESHSKYKKNYYPEFKHQNIPELSSKLGPGQYFTSREEVPFGINAKKFSFGGKHSHNYELRVAAEMPSCNHYSPQNSLVKSARFSDITFGIGVD